MNFSQGRTNYQFDPFEPHPELDHVDVPDNTDWVSNSDPFGFFSSRGMAAPKTVPPKEVQAEADSRSSRILSNYAWLGAVVDRHEETIQKRWDKKSKPQRLAMLVEAWPTMASTHRPDFAVFRKNGKQPSNTLAEDRDAFLMPYINREDLIKPRSLPLFLNARARNHPSSFAAVDGEAQHLGKVSFGIVPIFLNEYVMLLNGITRDKDYGKVMSWDDHEDAFDWMNSRKQFLPGEGLLILEAQDSVMEFLVSFCKKILHDIPLDKIASGEYSIKPTPMLKLPDSDGMSSLTVLAEEAQYRPPQNIDFQKLASLLAARTRAAEDNIWALREDPSYFLDRMLEAKEHRQELIKDTRGDLHPSLKRGQEDIFWARVLGCVLLESHTLLELFTELGKQAERLRVLEARYRDQLRPLESLPEEYLNAILRFRHYLNQVAKGPMSRLKEIFSSSPNMRDKFVRDVPASSSSTAMVTRSKPSVKWDKTESQVIWLMQALMDDSESLFFFRLPAVVDELERVLKAEPKAAQMLSPYAAALIGDLSIVAECLRQIDIYQPWANGFESALVDKEPGLEKDYERFTDVHLRILKGFKDRSLVSLVHLASPSENKFDYPIGKRRNKINVDRIRESESNLDRLWEAVDETLYRKVGGIEETELQRLLAQPRALRRTPEYVEPPTVKKGEKKPSLSSAPEIEALYRPFSALYLGPEPSSGSSARKEALLSSAAAVKSQKTKTRGTATTTTEELPPPVTAPTPVDQQPTFHVDARALKVFRIVFFDQASHTTAGEVAWNDFLHAMASTGFAAEKLYGSVWHFQPTKLDVERSIQFHEPHPRGKIPFLVARRHGRRLNRAYGWVGGMFVLK